MNPVRVVTTSDISADLLTAIRRLADSAFEGDFFDDDWDHTLGGHHFLVTDRDDVIAHAAVVPRILEADGRPLATGYVEAVATNPARQHQGFGSLVMTDASTFIRREFLLGALGTGSHEFYERLGWERWGGPTYVRHDSALVRTKEDDEGVMVLRFGTSLAVDLTAPLSCDDRAGDVW